MAQEYVLVTGATGFIGAHVLDLLLKKEYRVRFTARSQKKADSLIARYPQYKDKLDYVIIEDLVKENAFAGHLNGLTGIFHVASPFMLQVEDNLRDLINPAVNGVVSLLSEAVKVSTIKRIVITASFACIVNLANGPGYVYSERDYNPITLEDSVKGDAVVAYVGSKRLAEMAAFEFVEKNKPHFDIAVMCPPMVFGPLVHHIDKLSELSESTKLFYELITGKQEIKFYPFDNYIDVRDLALAHFLAFQNPKASNQRYLVSNGNYSFQEIVDFAHKNFAGKIKASVGTPGVYLSPFGITDNSKSINELGISYLPKEKTFHDVITQFLEFEAQGK